MADNDNMRAFFNTLFDAEEMKILVELESEKDDDTIIDDLINEVSD